jgi:hypothetical protein
MEEKEKPGKKKKEKKGQGRETPKETTEHRSAPFHSSPNANIQNHPNTHA